MKGLYRFALLTATLVVGSWAAAQANTAASDVAKFMNSFSAKDIEIRFARSTLNSQPRNVKALETLQRRCGELHLEIGQFLSVGAKSLAGSDADKGRGAVFTKALEEYDRSLSKLLEAAAQMRGHGSKAKMGGMHEQWLTVNRVITSYLRLDEFDPKLITGPTRYNLNAFLQDDSDGAIFADPNFPNAVRIWKTSANGKDALRPGDVIVAVKGEEDEEWVNVATWHDLIERVQVERFFEERSEVEVKYKRGSKVREKDLVIGKWMAPISKE